MENVSAKVLLSVDDYKDLVEAEVRLALIEKAYSKYDKYDFYQAIQPMMSNPSYEELEESKRKIEAMRKELADE